MGKYIPAASIDEVLSQLTQIIAESENKGDRRGYFAALYFQVTSKVKDGIAHNQFENGPRMERLDVLFANRYLLAFNQWENNLPLSGSWKIAFEATKRSEVLVVQHLLLGINAHINLDLGIAAVETSLNQPLTDIQDDFNIINEILSAMTYKVIHDVNRVSPLISLIGLHAGNTESVLAQFSIDNARDGAWCFAEALMAKKGADYQSCISDRDKDISTLAQALVDSRGVIRITLWIIHLFEWKNPKKIVRVLCNAKKKFIKVATLPTLRST